MLAVVALFGWGCAHFDPKPLAPAETAASLEARTIDAPALKRFLELNLGRALAEWPLKSWDLETLTLVALHFHPDLEVARTHWRVSEAEIVTAGGRPNPTLAVTPGYNFSAVNGVSPWMPAMTIDWPVETAGKRSHRIARAQHLASSAQLNIAATFWRVRSSLRTALIEFHDSARRQELLRQQAQAQERLLTSLQQRADAGTIAALEVAPARIGLQKLQADSLEIDRRAAEAGAQVATALGVPEAALAKAVFRFDGEFSSPDELTSSEVRQRALTSRADIGAALMEYEAAQSSLQLEIARQYPDIHLGTGYQWDQGESKWQLGLTAEIPVINQNQGPIATASARRAEAAARFVALQAKAMGEIDRALAGFRASAARGKALGELVASLRQQREAIAGKVNVGVSDRIDLLAADVEFAAAELQQWDGELKTIQAVGALEDAVQRPLNPVWQQSIESRSPTEKEQP